MHRTSYSIAGLALAVVLTLAAGVEAREHQQHHREATQASAAQAVDTRPEASEPGQMRGQLQGMMEHMQGMMERMQGMMRMMGRGGMPGHGGMMGMMGRRGMMAEDDEQDTPWGGMMGHHGMMSRSHRMGHGGKIWHLVERLTQQLDLTHEQESQVRSLVRAHMKDAIRAKADIAVNRLDLHELLEAESVELPKVKELLQTIASQKADLRFAHITLLEDIGQVLTPEQQTKFRSLRRQMMRGGRGMMGGEGMRRPGGRQGRGGMMGGSGKRGQGSMRNPCGMMGGGMRTQ